jgi:hypothetical protein
MDMNIINENNIKTYMQQNKIKTIYTNYLSYTPDIQNKQTNKQTNSVAFSPRANYSETV